jgi:hypothetical protein
LVNSATPEFTDNFGPPPALASLRPVFHRPPLHQPPIDIPSPSRFLQRLQQRVRSLLPFNLHQLALLYTSTASPCGVPGPSWTFPIIPASTLVSRHPVDLPHYAARRRVIQRVTRSFHRYSRKGSVGSNIICRDNGLDVLPEPDADGSSHQR